MISARSLVRSQEGPPGWRRGCSSVGRAPALQAGGRRFESGHLHQARIESDVLASDKLAAFFDNRRWRRSRVARRFFRRARREGRDRGQASKGGRRMPRRREAKKDVASCEKPRGAASRPRAADIRMGEPGRGHARSWLTECIGQRTRTEGTETSQYLEDKKSTEMAQVAASERARA